MRHSDFFRAMPPLRDRTKVDRDELLVELRRRAALCIAQEPADLVAIRLTKTRGAPGETPQENPGQNPREKPGAKAGGVPHAGSAAVGADGWPIELSGEPFEATP